MALTHCPHQKQLSFALSFLHAHEILHRDIKCANIMFDASGGVKFVDFGVREEFPRDFHSKLQSIISSLWHDAPEKRLTAKELLKELEIPLDKPISKTLQQKLK